MIPQEIQRVIQRYPDNDLMQLARIVQQEYGFKVTIADIQRLRSKQHVVKEGALDLLKDGMSIMASVSNSLLSIYNDENRPDEIRLTASKELRQWLKLGLDASGIATDKEEPLFAANPEWDTVA